MKFTKLISVLCLACLALTAGPAAAQSGAWPTKPVRIVVTFAPGGSSDIVARLIAGPLQEKLGQPVVVDNKPGGGATIGAAEVARAAPDGYTLMLSNSAPISISPFMLAQPTYDPVKSFTHVAYIGVVANVFVVHPSVPAKTMAELITWIKAQPNPVNYGSGGIGSIGHIVGETLKNEHGLKMEHVGYKGSSPMHNDLLGGTIQLAIDTLPQNVPFMKDGKLRAIAVTSSARAAMAADVPSVVEVNEKKLVAENFFGVTGPAGMPQPVVAKLHAAMAEVMSNPTIIKRLEDLGITSKKLSTAEFTKFVEDQVKEWAPAVRASGAKLNYPMPGVSIHVVDVSRGLVAAGMRVELFALAPQRTQVAGGVISTKGLLEEPALNVRFAPGEYEAVFHVAAYYAGAGVPLPAVPFLDIVSYRFGIAEPDQHYHLPFKVTPWGYSCFRGGA